MIEIDEMENRLDEMTKFFIFSQEEFKTEIDAMLKTTSSNIKEIADARETIKKNILTIEEKKSELTTNKKKYEDHITTLKQEYKNHIERLNNEYQNSIQNLVTEYNERVDNRDKQYNSLAQQTNFIAALLSAKPSLNKYLLDFEILINKDFLNFSQSNRYNAQDTQSLLKLQDIKRELESFISAPDIYSKSTMAILSEYESGKSSMINSFLKSKNFEIPVEYDPLYTLPTYIIPDSDTTIMGINQKAAMVNIEEDFYHKLTNQYIKTMHFNLEEFMPFVVIRTPLNEKYFKNIALLDIQEFDPKNENKQVLESLNQAHITALLWVINLDKNLTVSASDLEFLKSLPNKNQKLYIVANIFENRDKNELKSRLNNIKNSLNNNGVEFIGVSAYSAAEKSEYGYIHKSLFDFIKEQNRPLLIQENLIVKIQNIFEVYKKTIKDTLKNIDSLEKQFDLLELDMREDGLQDENGIVSLRLSILRKLCKEKELKDDLKMVDILQSKFIATINKIFGRDITL